ncbi:hypothetical protein CANARDRAFT_173598 [[Candida] arabinofermentans NRRL YB-2248]|uniref:Uncharacterized protein n=1 Tax=[Candida] arabinofermentans NRRL YB-2248 TaxID=983967 RepID=A0A1E4T7D2_9ASCO|nr:hypothetical protein CANARDRAFT_173598 [[Candida] arabinofermentans NRRL YB-2248]
MKIPTSLVEKSLKKTGYIPKPISESLITNSPTFQTPSKWIAKPKRIASDQRIQTYSEITNNIYALQLLSPPRLTLLSRITVPRSFLIPMHFVRNNIDDSVNFKYFVVPRLEKPKSSLETTEYYPLDYSTLEISGDGGTTGASKLNKIQSLNIRELDGSVGWLNKTARVIHNLKLDQLRNSFEEMSDYEYKSTPDSSDDQVVGISFDEDCKYVFEHVSTDDKSGTIFTYFNLFTLLQKEPELYSQIKEYFQLLDKTHCNLPVTDKTSSFISNLYTYSLFMERYLRDNTNRD